MDINIVNIVLLEKLFILSVSCIKTLLVKSRGQNIPIPKKGCPRFSVLQFFQFFYFLFLDGKIDLNPKYFVLDIVGDNLYLRCDHLPDAGLHLVVLEPGHQTHGSTLLLHFRSHCKGTF